jgi:hypothetical protein
VAERVVHRLPDELWPRPLLVAAALSPHSYMIYIWSSLSLLAVLAIRIRSDPNLFAGSGFSSPRMDPTLIIYIGLQ